MAIQSYWKSYNFYSILIGPFITQILVGLAFIIYSLLLGTPLITITLLNKNDEHLGIVIIKNSGDYLYDASFFIESEKLKIVDLSGDYRADLSQPSGYIGYVLSVADIRPHSAATIILKSDSDKGIVEITRIKSNIPSEFENISKYVSTKYPIGVFISLTINFVFLVVINFTNDRFKKSTDDKYEAITKDLEEKRSQIEKLSIMQKNFSQRTTRYLVYFRKLTESYVKENEFWRRVFERVMTNESVTKHSARQLISVIRGAIGAKKDADADNLSTAKEIRHLDRVLEVIFDQEKTEGLNKMFDIDNNVDPKI